MGTSKMCTTCSCTVNNIAGGKGCRTMLPLRYASMLATASVMLLAATVRAEYKVVDQWNGRTVTDLHREYGNIFKYGNRNAASHLWSTFILERARQMPPKRLKRLFSGFCAISGSPVTPNDYNRYRLTLSKVDGGRRTGFMHYCCWPCVCDTLLRHADWC